MCCAKRSRLPDASRFPALPEFKYVDASIAHVQRAALRWIRVEMCSHGIYKVIQLDYRLAKSIGRQKEFELLPVDYKLSIRDRIRIQVSFVNGTARKMALKRKVLPDWAVSDLKLKSLFNRDYFKGSTTTVLKFQ